MEALWTVDDSTLLLLMQPILSTEDHNISYLRTTSDTRPKDGIVLTSAGHHTISRGPTTENHSQRKVDKNHLYVGNTNLFTHTVNISPTSKTISHDRFNMTHQIL